MLTALLLLIPAALPTDTTPAGTWQLASVHRDGQAERPGAVQLTLAGGAFALTRDGQLEAAGLLDLRPDGTADFCEPEFGIVVTRCLWRLRGGRLQLCVSEGDERPRVWTAANGSGQTVSTFRRVR